MRERERGGRFCDDLPQFFFRIIKTMTSYLNDDRITRYYYWTIRCHHRERKRDRKRTGCVWKIGDVCLTTKTEF